MKFIGRKISYLEKPEECSIVISSSPDKKQGYFRMIWFLLWTACGIVAISFFPAVTVREQKVMLFVFLGFWLYFEWKSLQLFLWKWKGREVIKIRPDGLRVGERTYGKGKALLFRYDGFREIKKVVQNRSSPLNILRAVDLFARNGTITLNYFGKEYSFGYDLAENETAELYSLLRREIRKYKKD
ncbi:MAG: hypothetical protein IT233_09320 [Bacteroidia bacterium]|nr:hypothetical protein [Bacteroidia bacterium]